MMTTPPNTPSHLPAPGLTNLPSSVEGASPPVTAAGTGAGIRDAGERHAMIEPIPEKSRTVAGIKEGMKSGYYVTPENNEPFCAMEHLINVVDLQAAEIIAWREMASYYLDSESTTHQCDLMAKKLLGRTAADYAGKTVMDSADLAKLRASGKAAAVLSHLIDLHEFPGNAQHLIDRIKEETAPFLGNGLIDPPDIEGATLKAKLAQLKAGAAGLVRIIGEHVCANNVMSADLAKLKLEADDCDHHRNDLFRHVIKLRTELEKIRGHLILAAPGEHVSHAYSIANLALTDLDGNAAKMTERTRAAAPAEICSAGKDCGRFWDPIRNGYSCLALAAGACPIYFQTSSPEASP